MGAEEVRINAVTGAQTEHHTLEHDLIRSEILETTDRSKITLGCRLNIRVQRRIIPEAPAVKEAMCSRAKTQILTMIPVGSVVAGAVSRESEIGNFVVFISGRPKFRAKDIILTGTHLVRSLSPHSSVDKRGQGTARLDRQLV